MKKKHIKSFVFVIYIVLSFIVLNFHENWEDESQAWLLARDLNLIELIGYMKYEGHFLLWYVILMPFAKLNLPYNTMNVISWIITSVSVYLILYKLNINFFTKLLLIFSCPMIYLFPAIARCYCLIPLAIVLIMIFYENRLEHTTKYILSIVLLANTHIIMLGMVGILTIELLIDFIKEIKESNLKLKQYCLNILLLCLLLVLTGLPILGSLKTNYDVMGFMDKSIKTKIHDSLFYYPAMYIYNNYYQVFPDIINTIIVLMVIIILIFLIINDNRNAIRILAFFWPCILAGFIYPSINEQKAATFFMILLPIIFMSKYYNDKNKRIINVLFSVLLLINMIVGLKPICLDIQGKYSCAYEAGNYINKLEDSIILVGDRSDWASAVIPYVNKNILFFHIPSQRYFTFTKLDAENEKKMEIDEFYESINKFKGKNLYYIRIKNNEKSFSNDMLESNVFEKVFESDNSYYFIESYIIYKINI